MVYNVYPLQYKDYTIEFAMCAMIVGWSRREKMILDDVEDVEDHEIIFKLHLLLAMVDK